MAHKLVKSALGEIASKELLEICDKSRLPNYHKSLMRNERMEPLNRLSQYRKEFVRNQFALRGRQSGLHPGVVYPRKEELHHLKQMEKAFYPPLQNIIEENLANNRKALEERTERERTVLMNLSRLDKEKELFFEKLNQKKHEKQMWLEKKEKLIEEVREFLGYRVDPHSDKFKEALAQKEIEEAKAKKKAARNSLKMKDLEDILGGPKTVTKQ